MDENLTPKQIRAIEVYALTGNATAAAEAGGISRQQFYRWRAEPEFYAELRRLDGDALQNVGRRVLGLSEAAGRALEDGLDEKQSIQTRLRAADVVLSRLLALLELTQVVQRLEALEAKK